MATLKTKLTFLKEILALKECIDCGKIKNAAIKNGLKQENLSKIIADLENVTHTTLLHRSTNGIAPTNVARLMYEDIEKISRMTDDLAQKIMGEKELSGYITIWSEEGFTGSYMLKVLSEFYKHYPKIRLDILSSRDTNLSQVDIAIVHNYTQQKVQGQVLFTTQVKTHFYSSKAYLDKKGCPKNFNDLLENYDLCMRQFYLDWPECGNILKKAKHLNTTADLISIIVSLVKSGEGIGLLPDWCAQMNPDLILVDNIDFETQHIFKGICKPGMEEDPKIQALNNFLRERLEDK